MLSQALDFMLDDRVYRLLGLQLIAGQLVDHERVLILVLQDHLALHLTDVFLHRVVGEQNEKVDRFAQVATIDLLRQKLPLFTQRAGQRVVDEHLIGELGVLFVLVLADEFEDLLGTVWNDSVYCVDGQTG